MKKSSKTYSTDNPLPGRGIKITTKKGEMLWNILKSY